MDPLSKEQRSRLMASVKGKNTGLEKRLRSALWARGIRGFRVNYKIRGTPDIFFPGCKVAVFVDGCFWHKCPSCYSKPKTNAAYWERKVDENENRDRHVDSDLASAGYRVVRIWEHEIRNSIDAVAEGIAVELEKCKHGSGKS